MKMRMKMRMRMRMKINRKETTMMIMTMMIMIMTVTMICYTFVPTTLATIVNFMLAALSEHFCTTCICRAARGGVVAGFAVII